MIERGEAWYRDDGALTRVFCEDSELDTLPFLGSHEYDEFQ